MFKSEGFLIELQSMGIQIVYAARMDATLTPMRVDFSKAAVKESVLDTFAIGSEEVNVVSDVFGRSDSVADDNLIEFKSIDESEEEEEENDVEEEDNDEEEEGVGV